MGPRMSSYLVACHLPRKQANGVACHDTYTQQNEKDVLYHFCHQSSLRVFAAQVIEQAIDFCLHYWIVTREKSNTIRKWIEIVSAKARDCARLRGFLLWPVDIFLCKRNIADWSQEIIHVPCPRAVPPTEPRSTWRFKIQLERSEHINSRNQRSSNVHTLSREASRTVSTTDTSNHLCDARW
jgi:hypothetical protein